jgi:hypothetical protein
VEGNRVLTKERISLTLKEMKKWKENAKKREAFRDFWSVAGWG